tara:strand:- start:54 stop:257 length:204 start_codon:yes stop_codon:yes gene_type:complete
MNYKTELIHLWSNKMTQTKISGKKLLDKLTELGWDYQCMTRSGKETYDEIMTMFGVLEEGETWLEED